MGWLACGIVSLTEHILVYRNSDEEVFLKHVRYSLLLCYRVGVFSV